MGDRHAVGPSVGVSRPDLILLSMPLLFVGGYGVGASVFDGWPAATAIASLACVILMLDGLVRHPPLEG